MHFIVYSFRNYTELSPPCGRQSTSHGLNIILSLALILCTSLFASKYQIILKKKYSFAVLLLAHMFNETCIIVCIEQASINNEIQVNSHKEFNSGTPLNVNCFEELAVIPLKWSCTDVG